MSGVFVGTVCKPCWVNWKADNAERHEAHRGLSCGASWYVTVDAVCMCGCRSLADRPSLDALAAAELAEHLPDSSCCDPDDVTTTRSTAITDRRTVRETP